MRRLGSIMKQEHIQYILEHKGKKSVEEIARDLNIREKNVRKFLKQRKISSVSPVAHNDPTPSIGIRKLVLCIAVIVLTGFAVYGNSLDGPFIWDDKQLVQDDVRIKDGGKSIGHILSNSLRASSDGSTTSFRPLQTITYIFDYSLWRTNVLGYHLTNVTFHILTALAIFWFVRILFGNISLSFLTAFLFLLHPVHTEAVSYISGRADPMVMFFMMISFCLYLNSCSKQTVLNIGFMSFCYLCALLSRENGLILPLLILFYHYVFKKPIPKKAFASIIVVSLIYIVWRGIVFKGTVTDMPMETTLWQRTPGMFVAFTNYIRLLFVPFGLHMEYGGLLFYWNEPKIYVGLGLFLGVLFLWYKRREDRLTFYSVGWFLIALFPLSNIYALNAYMAEHWLYMPSVGFFLLLANFIGSAYRTQKYRFFAVVLCIGLTLYYGGMTIYQNHFWRDPIRFYTRMLKFNTESARLYNNLVSEHIKARKEGDLITLLESARKIDPTNEVIYNNLGIAYNRTGNSRKALSAYEKAFELDPDYGLAYYNAGVIYADNLGEYDKGLALLKKGIERDPSIFQGYHKIGVIYLMQERRSEALAMLNKAVEVNPDAWMVYRSLGYYYYLEGNEAKAIENYTIAVEQNPYYAEALYDLAAVYYKQGQMSLARKYYDKAAALGYHKPELLKALEGYK